MSAPSSRAISATIGAASGAGAAAFAGRDEHHVRALDRVLQLVAALGRRGLPTSGFAPAPRPRVDSAPMWTFMSASTTRSAWASVFAAMKSTPLRPASTMRLTAFDPPPPTPTTLICQVIACLIAYAQRPSTSKLDCSSRLRKPPATPQTKCGLLPCQRIFRSRSLRLNLGFEAFADADVQERSRRHTPPRPPRGAGCARTCRETASLSGRSSVFPSRISNRSSRTAVAAPPSPIFTYRAARTSAHESRRRSGWRAPARRSEYRAHVRIHGALDPDDQEGTTEAAVERPENASLRRHEPVLVASPHHGHRPLDAA